MSFEPFRPQPVIWFPNNEASTRTRNLELKSEAKLLKFFVFSNTQVPSQDDETVFDPEIKKDETVELRCLWLAALPFFDKDTPPYMLLKSALTNHSSKARTDAMRD